MESNNLECSVARIRKRIHTDSKMKHEVLDCSFEMLKPGGGGGAGAMEVSRIYPLPIAINTTRFYTLLQSQYTPLVDTH